MNKLVQALAAIIKDKVHDATKGRSGAKLESRFIFRGPPLDLLEPVFDELSSTGGILIPLDSEGMHACLPILLQLPPGHMGGANPEIGKSGKCDENHLLHIRNDPHSPSFVALVPPGQHNNRSVESTTDEFGMSASSSTEHATFEEWWADDFVQQLVTHGLKALGLKTDDQFDNARRLIEHAAMALDEMDRDKGSRKAVWRLLSRIYSIPGNTHGLPQGSSLALACGFPPQQDGGMSPKLQIGILAEIADEMADGFRTGIERIANGSPTAIKAALNDFLAHVQASCDIPTAFERATEAFYLADDSFDLEGAPSWWTTLTTECWAELLAEEPDETTGDLTIVCTNPILPVIRSLPAVVWNEAEFSISIGTGEAVLPVEAQLTGGSRGKTPETILIDGAGTFTDQPPASGQKSPITYKVTSDGRKAATTRVISLSTWIPGILATCRMACKLSPPKKPRKGSSGIDWESSLSLPGSGRYELMILVSPGTTVLEAASLPDEAADAFAESGVSLPAPEIRPGEYQIEIEADGQYQLEVSFLPAGRKSAETFRIYISCEETKEVGCRSEFERLIKRNRQHLEKFDTKAVVQLDRNARASSLQSWMLDAEAVDKSFLPLVIADDYAAVWAPPNWGKQDGPILSQARFLHDPRPAPSLFQPPPGFVEARRRIAERIRASMGDDQSGLTESAPLGKWLSNDSDFRTQVEAYLDAYMSWLASDRDTACWVDAIAVCAREAGGRTLARIPDAIILSPLHPLRLAWHCLAQHILHEEVEGKDPCPCPAASILDPDCVPDLLTISLQSPGGEQGIDRIDFLSVECNSDYWSVLWNGTLLAQLADRSRLAPFDNTFGLVVGGISSGFSPAQVARALEDVSDLLAAKPILSLAVSSAGGASDACNEGLTSWCTSRFGDIERAPAQGVGSRILEVYDTRPPSSRPDQATIANLSEDTNNHVRWFEKQPTGTRPDLGIIAQLDSAQPESKKVGTRSPLGLGGLIRHRVRRQLHGAFLSESRQSMQMPPSGDVFADKVANCMLALENEHNDRVGLQFAPNVHAVTSMLMDNNAGFVAISSSAIDPACFLGGWIKGTYLWDYDLPSYSHRAGDTSGYYLLSQVRDADRDALKRVLDLVPGGRDLNQDQIQQILLEVARRGIPTVRGLAGDDTGATGDLGLFLAVRLLQDQFRLGSNKDSLLPVLSGSEDDASIAIIIPVDPFRGYLADLARSLGKERKDTSLSRPDLLVVGIRTSGAVTRLHFTPIEVKCRQGVEFNGSDAKDALGQAKALSTLFHSLQERSSSSPTWKLAFQHLLLSMVGFGLRVYSQHELVAKQGGLWASYHERITATILGSDLSGISIDDRGRLIVVDGTPHSAPRDHDNDGFNETIIISASDAGLMVSGDAQIFYDQVRPKVEDWELFPKPAGEASALSGDNPILRSGDTMAENPHAEETYPETASSDDGIAKDGDVSVAGLASQGQEASDTSLPSAPQSPCSGIVLSVGSTVDGFEPRPLCLNISDTRLNQLNIGVVGDLGTGKTQLLKSLIFQIATARHENRSIKPRFLIFDYKRDYSSPEFVEATGARVVKPSHLPLNLFDTSPMGESIAPWLDRFRFFADVLDKVYSGIGPVQRDKLKGAVRNAYEFCRAEGRQPTIYDIHTEYRDLLGGKSDSPMAIIDDLVDMEIFEQDPAKTKTFDEFLDGIVVISLDAMGQDDRSKNMLVAIMLNMFYENMLKTPKRPFVGEKPQLRVIDSYLLVDEADNIMRYEFDVLRKLLLQGREFGAGVILASQYLRHFKASTTDYREPLLTWFIHKVPNVTPAELGALGFTSDLSDLSDRVKTLPNHHCLYKSFDVAGEVIRGLPFYELDTGKPHRS